ncbi:hypothetical protein CK203_039833 [Vitis vinifera]|uniref:Uncharacterized protein n=1 Tax=Vitis vinifera TaxID=29760 RepID=A0A438HQH0_VITVI|nr:hypothetical protein CK203_039833 [Vitis vinifera]
MGHQVTPFVGFVVGDASNKEAWVNEVWTAEGEWGGSWNPCFNRPFNDWEMEEVERLFCCLEGKKTVLARLVLDHFSILLDGGGLRKGPTSFKFENMWLKEEGFKSVLRMWWEGLNFSGSASFILAEKSKALKPVLRSWNKEVFGKGWKGPFTEEEMYGALSSFSGVKLQAQIETASGGLLFLLPRMISSENGDDMGRGDQTFEEKLMRNILGELEQLLIHASIPYPVYFAFEDDNIDDVLTDIKRNDATSQPATATTGGGLNLTPEAPVDLNSKLLRKGNPHPFEPSNVEALTKACLNS